MTKKIFSSGSISSNTEVTSEIARLKSAYATDPSMLAALRRLFELAGLTDQDVATDATDDADDSDL